MGVSCRPVLPAYPPSIQIKMYKDTGLFTLPKKSQIGGRNVTARRTQQQIRRSGSSGNATVNHFTRRAVASGIDGCGNNGGAVATAGQQYYHPYYWK